jgi:nitric oxide reductase subunit B
VSEPLQLADQSLRRERSAKAAPISGVVVGKVRFWSLNSGLAWMCFATLFPLGSLQLYESVSRDYFEARTLEYLTNLTNALIEWMRLPGDVAFILGAC